MLLGLLFNPEHGGDMFLWNINLSELHCVRSQKTGYACHPHLIVACLTLQPEDGGDMFLRNIDLYPN
jgi:hypothetical protein